MLGGYFVLLALSGWWFSRREPSGTHEYFLAGRQMPMWAVAISVLATATSAATFIGAPEEAYRGNLTYISTNIGTIVAVLVVAFFFIPAFYKANVTTVYDLLENQFGSKAKQAASWTFLIGRVFASGSRLFMSGIPLSLILFRDTQSTHLLIAIGVLVSVGTVYTLIGGIRSIIWTDVIQTVVFVGAAVIAMLMLLHRIPASTGTLYDALRVTQVGGDSKLMLLDSGIPFDSSKVYTLLTAVFGFSLLGVASYGTDHDLAQRMLTCRSALKGSQSVIMAIAINLPVLCVFMVIGLLLHIFYQRPDLMGSATPALKPEDSRQVFLSFILNEMPPGMSGLMMAGLFAAGLGSCNSAINAMAAAFVNDWYKKVSPGKSDEAYLRVGRWAVVGWGVVLGSFAAVCVYWQEGSGQTLLQFALSVMNFAYAGLLGVFFTAIFFKSRGNGTTAIAALVVGFSVVAVLQKWAIAWWAPAMGLKDFAIAFPWVLLIATGCSTGVCVLGKPRRSDVTVVNVAR